MNNHAERQNILNLLASLEQTHKRANYVIKEATMTKLWCEKEMLKLNSQLAQNDTDSN